MTSISRIQFKDYLGGICLAIGVAVLSHAGIESIFRSINGENLDGHYGRVVFLLLVLPLGISSVRWLVSRRLKGIPLGPLLLLQIYGGCLLLGAIFYGLVLPNIGEKRKIDFGITSGANSQSGSSPPGIAP